MSESQVPKKKGLSFPGAKAKVTIVKAMEPIPITSERPPVATVDVKKVIPRPVIATSARRSLNIFAKRDTPGKATVAKTVSVEPPTKKEKPRVQFKNEVNVKLVTPVGIVTEEKEDVALLKLKSFFDGLKEETSADFYEDINLEDLASDEPENDGRFFYMYDNDINEDFTSLNNLFTVIEFGKEGFHIDRTDTDKVDEEKGMLFDMFREMGEEEEEEEEVPVKPLPTSSLDSILTDETLGPLAEEILEKEGRLPGESEDQKYADAYSIEKPATGFLPQNRRAFTDFIYDTFEPFKLPPLPKEPDPNACMTVMQSDRAEMYKYQQFIREYMTWQSPYRGILVYHGLGSGKTCTSIAAAEALFATFPSSDRKIIVMTPFSLRQNFIGEITTCGFQHFRLRNHWIPQSLSDPLVKTFAKSVMHIPQQYLDRVSRIWIPDFTKEQNYQAPGNATAEQKTRYLSAKEQDEVREQINNILVYDPKKKLYGRIRFISYNGFSKKDLMEIACTKPHEFDNAVIIIDEIHNLVRIMQGTIEPYLTKLTQIKARRTQEFEPIEWDKWKPKLCPADWKEYEADKELRKKSYKRGYLFYRLLVQATNSKIIGLSGTPLINFAEELGILSNLLHGYNHIVEGSVAKADVRQQGSDAKDKATMEKIRKLLTENPYTDFQDIKMTEKVIQFRTTFLPEAIKKLTGQPGVIRAAPGEPIVTFAERLASLQADFEKEGLKLLAPKGAESKFTVQSEPLLPPLREEFQTTFINKTDNVSIENELVLIKRLTGLISYYKGSREDLMPRIRRDETVFVPMSIYQQTQYSKARLEEIDIEEKKEKKKKDEGVVEVTGRLAALFAEVYEIKNLPQSSNYRMGSRQTCNFAFPTEVIRPRPRNKLEQEAEVGTDVPDIIDAEIQEGADLATTVAEERAAAEAVNAEDEEEREAELGTVATEQGGGGEANSGGFNEVNARREAMENAELSEESNIQDYINAMRSLWERENPIEPIGEDGLTVEQRRCRALRLPGENYAQQIERAKNCLATLAADKLKMGPTGLGETSPKYQRILENIQAAPGSSLVYSQFLQMEGIGIFTLAMDANGYEPIEIKFNRQTQKPFFTKRTLASLAKGPTPPGESIKQLRYIKFTGEDEDIVRRYALLLFNARFSDLPRELSDVLAKAGWKNNDKGDLCRVFCITSAGAEGLSLKNVRAVHIMEPYWNDVRTAQVKGRAVRICSHAELPPEERTVDIFTYVTVFSKEAQTAKTGAIQIAEKIVNRDSLSDADAKIAKLPIPTGALQYTLTSDQRLWLISNRKKALIDNLQKVMKSAAVDCTLNYQEDKEKDPEKAFKCVTFAYDKVGDFMYDPNLERDIQLTKTETKTIKKAVPVAPVATTMAPVAPVVVPVSKKKKAKIQDVEYYLEPELDTSGKTVKFYLYADIDMKTRVGEIAAIESKKTPGTYGPKGSALKLY